MVTLLVKKRRVYMGRKNFLFVLVLLVVSIFYSIQTIFAQEAEFKDLYIELILDASNSMNEPLNGRPKIDIAKEALNEVLGDLSKDTYLALRVYGSDKSKMQIQPGMSETDAKKFACSDSVLKAGFGKENASEIRQIINSTVAVGFTPIAYSLELAGSDFPKTEGNNYIILASDGQETCGGDPVAVINALKEKGIKIVVHTIGFAVDEETKKQLEDIAKAGGGNYYNADNAGQLKDSLIKVIDKIKEMQGKADEFLKGSEVKPGSSYDNAPLLEVGEYKLSNLAVGANIKHVVRVAVKKGQVLRGVATYIGIAGPKTDPENGRNDCSFNVFDKNNRNIFSGDGDLDMQKPCTFEFIGGMNEDTECYLVFNSTYSTVWGSAGPAGFSVALSLGFESRFDVNSGSDVGGEFKAAYLIMPGSYDESWIFPDEDVDKYKLELQQGQTLSVKIFPSEKWSAELVIYNEDREEVISDHSKNNGSAAKAEYTAKNKEEVYMDVKRYGSQGDTAGAYEMKVEIRSAEPEQPKMLETE
jgi:hypothetical protein